MPRRSAAGLVAIALLAIAILLQSRPRLASLEYEEVVGVGGVERISARVEGLPLSVKTVVYMPNGTYVEFQGGDLSLVAGAEGVYLVRVYALSLIHI